LALAVLLPSPEDVVVDGAAAAENTNDISATDGVTDPITLGNFSIGYDATKEPMVTPSVAVASSTLSPATAFFAVTVTLAVFCM
jgi:hypothetical protein